MVNSQWRNMCKAVNHEPSPGNNYLKGEKPVGGGGKQTQSYRQFKAKIWTNTASDWNIFIFYYFCLKLLFFFIIIFFLFFKKERYVPPW